MQTVEAPAQQSSGRILGLDIARAFAIVGMVIVNYKYAMGAEEAGSEGLRFFAALFDGRAVATFVVLAGVGASLGSRRAREGDDPVARRGAQVTLAKRGVFLFALGWLFFLVWPADILHYYGIFLLVGSVLLYAPSRVLVGVAAASMAISLVFLVAFDFFANWNLDDISYAGIATPAGFARNLFVDGFHPVFPWVAFYLFGMWLGRTDLRDPRWRRVLVVRAAAVLVVTEAAAWIVLGPKGSGLDDLDEQSWRWLFSVEPLPPFPPYLLAGGATAVLVVMGSIWLGERLPSRLSEPLVSTGQLALSIYLAHVLVGLAILDEAGRLDDQSLAWAVGTGLVFSVVAVLGSWAWRRRFDRGPFEWLMRRVAG